MNFWHMKSKPIQIYLIVCNINLHFITGLRKLANIIVPDGSDSTLYRSSSYFPSFLDWEKDLFLPYTFFELEHEFLYTRKRGIKTNLITRLIMNTNYIKRSL